MKNCVSCGFQNDENQKFCHQCGAGLQISLADFLEKHALTDFLGVLQARQVASLHELKTLLVSDGQPFAYGDLVRIRKAMETEFPDGKVESGPATIKVVDQQEMVLKMRQAEDLIVKDDYRAAHQILESIREGGLHSGDFVQLYVFASAHVAPSKAMSALRNSSWSDPHRYFLEFCMEKNDTNLLRIIKDVRVNYPENSLGSLLDSVHCLMKAVKNAKPGIAEKAREYFDTVPEGSSFETSRRSLGAVLDWSYDTFQPKPVLDESEFLRSKLNAIMTDMEKYGVVSLLKRKEAFLNSDILNNDTATMDQPENPHP